MSSRPPRDAAGSSLRHVEPAEGAARFFNLVVARGPGALLVDRFPSSLQRSRDNVSCSGVRGIGEVRPPGGQPESATRGRTRLGEQLGLVGSRTTARGTLDDGNTCRDPRQPRNSSPLVSERASIPNTPKGPRDALVKFLEYRAHGDLGYRAPRPVLLHRRIYSTGSGVPWLRESLPMLLLRSLRVLLFAASSPARLPR